MKKLLLFLALIHFVQIGKGTTFLQDSFLIDGSLNGQLPLVGSIWTNNSGTLGQMQVVGGKVEFNGGNSEDIHSLFAWGGSGSLFVGFTLNASVVPNDGAGDYIASFRSSSFFNGRIFYSRPNAAPPDTFHIGIATNGTNSVEWPADLPIDTDFRVVVRITENGANDNVTLWIDPTNITDPSVATADNSFFNSITGFILRQGGGLTGQVSIDDIIVTDNFTDAAVVNTPPITEGGGIADIVVDQNALPTIIDLLPAFQDAQTVDSDLVYSVTATNLVSGDPQLFSAISIDNIADTLTLNYSSNMAGVFNIKVRATDPNALFTEDTFQVTVNEPIPLGLQPIKTNLVVAPAHEMVLVGKTLSLTATDFTTNGVSNVNLITTWSSQTPNIATVNNVGIVTGISPGEATITAIYDNQTNSVNVSVRKEFQITFGKIKPAKRTPKLKTGRGFRLSGKFETGSNSLTKADVISKPLKIQFAFLSVTNTNGTMAAFRDIAKITGFKTIKPGNKGRFVVNPVGTDLFAGNATVLLRAFLGPEDVNQEISQIFTNATSFELRRK